MRDRGSFYQLLKNFQNLLRKTLRLPSLFSMKNLIRCILKPSFPRHFCACADTRVQIQVTSSRLGMSDWKVDDLFYNFRFAMNLKPLQSWIWIIAAFFVFKRFNILVKRSVMSPVAIFCLSQSLRDMILKFATWK